MIWEHLLMWLLDFAVKGLAILALAGAMVGSMKRASAAARHLVWTLGVMAALLLPGMSVILPQWQVEILPATLFQPPSLANLVGEGTPAQKDATVRYFGSLLGLGGSIWNRVTPLADEPAAATADSASWINRKNLPAIVMVAWISGVVIVMLPWLAGAWVIWRMGRRAEPVTDAFITNMFRGLLWEYSIRRKVQFVVGTQSMTPMASGILRPRVMLPPEALRWPADRLRSVLLHELAHVKRWDCLTQLLGQLMCAIYWFNPMAWLLVRRMRAEHERACDDRVLAWGLGEASYAEHLVQVARSLRPPTMGWMGAVAMARPSQLRERLVAILDPNRPRGRVGKGAMAVAAILMLAMVAPLSMLHGADTPSQSPTTRPTADPGLDTSVLLVSDGNYYLERILAALPLRAVSTMSPTEFERAGAGDAGLVIFDRYTPRITPALPCMFFAAVASDGPTHARADVIHDVQLSVSKPDHPMVRDISFNRVYARSALRLDIAEQSKVLVQGNGEPMIVLDSNGNRRLVVGFDLLQSNWPLRVNFPVFMYRALEQLLAVAEPERAVQ